MLFTQLYFVTFLLFLLLDAVWLGVVARKMYQDQIGFLMTENIRWGAALLFYFLYIGGVVFFAIWPFKSEDSVLMPICYGALFGLMCYATYDLTNFATLKGWPLQVVVCDIIWGAFATGVAAGLAWWIVIIWKFGRP